MLTCSVTTNCSTATSRDEASGVAGGNDGDGGGYGFHDGGRKGGGGEGEGYQSSEATRSQVKESGSVVTHSSGVAVWSNPFCKRRQQRVPSEQQAEGRRRKAQQAEG